MWILFYSLVSFAGSTIGGAIGLGAVLITTPLLDLVAGGSLDFKQISMLNLMLVLTGTLTSALTHRRSGYIDRALLLRLAPVAAGGALLGGLLAHLVSDAALRWIFVAVALVSLSLGLLPFGSRLARGAAQVLRSPAVLEPAQSRWLPMLAVVAVTSTVSGLIGVGGGLLMTPFLLKLVRFPPKTTVGTMTAVGVATTVFALAGRIGTVPLPSWEPIVGVVIGAVAGGVVGALLTRVVPARAFAPVLSIVVVISAAQIILQQFVVGA